MVNEQGIDLFYDSLEARKKCCRVRKLQPLKRAFAGLDAWICGLRREQSVTRTGLQPVEFDEANGLAKINPLFDWTEEQVWDYIHANDVPWWNDMVICKDNPIINRGFIDIPDRPGLGIEDYNDEVLAEHVDKRQPGVWVSTDEWDDEWCRDRYFN